MAEKTKQLLDGKLNEDKTILDETPRKGKLINEAPETEELLDESPTKKGDLLKEKKVKKKKKVKKVVHTVRVGNKVFKNTKRLSKGDKKLLLSEFSAITLKARGFNI